MSSLPDLIRQSIPLAPPRSGSIPEWMPRSSRGMTTVECTPAELPPQRREMVMMAGRRGMR
mgnify:CR=1 FL=1